MEEQKTTVDQSKSVSISEAARLNNVTRQAIYVAIKLNKLRAHKENNKRWTIHLDDLADYRKGRYSRTRSMHNGELVFDANKGHYSVNQIAKILRVPTQKIYYATRKGQLKAHRRGAAWVIQVEDANEYRQKHLAKRRGKKAV